LPKIQAIQGVEFNVAMHNIRVLGIRMRLLEGYP
jgi:hypothetical protein